MTEATSVAGNAAMSAFCAESASRRPLPGGVRAGEQRVRDEAEGEEERCAPERGHQVGLEDFAGA